MLQLKKSLKFSILGVPGRPRSSLLVCLESWLAVLVMILEVIERPSLCLKKSV